MERLGTFLRQAGQEYRRMKLGLHRIEAALEELGRPERSFASVLIAGTNGKGSTARMVEAVLRQAGYRTGLYTSPHLLRFHERIRLNGEEVEGALLESILQEWSARGWLDAAANWPIGEERLTWFEKATALAFEAFRRAQVEIAILEVGLGGRMDATNAVFPLVSAVTGIGMDHAEILGTSLQEIAREKAGVMRRDRPLVLGPVEPELLPAFRRWSEEGGARLLEVKAPVGTSENFSCAGYRGLSLSLAGRHQLANAAVAVEILRVLSASGWAWEEEDLRAGLASVRHPGRLQWLSGEPPLLLDGAHNAQAFLALVDYLRERREKFRPVFLLAMLKEKDPEAALKILGPWAESFVFTTLGHPRALALEVWIELAKKHSINACFSGEPQAALQLARGRAGAGGWVVVTGSLYLVAEILARNSH